MTGNPHYQEQSPNEVTIPVVPHTAEFDAWLQSVRLLVSQIGFALDNYLESRPAPITTVDSDIS